MKKNVAFLLCCFFITVVSFAQTEGDSVSPPKDTAAKQVVRPVKKDTTTTIRKTVAVKKRVDSSARIPDTVVTPVKKDSVTVVITASPAQLNAIKRFQAALRDHPYYNFFGKPLVLLEKERTGRDKDGLFYFMAGLVFYFALIKLFFSKYVDNIMTLFFRVTMRHQQLRDQLLQTPLASLLLNILFVITGGLFFTFVARHYGIASGESTWVLFGYSSALLVAIYLAKFLVLKITGWIFNVSTATDTYIFIVFLVNKMISIFLLPALVMMAFPYPPLYPVVLTLSFIMWGIFLAYRFLISYKPIRNEIKVSRFHFFLYLCAFEIAPLLLIYKVLLIFVERSY